jgi:23S rRNA pseudouridine2605 synthase
LGSRRECEEYILQGRVTVDGKVVRELGSRVDPEHSTIAVDGERIRLEKLVYYAVNKPKGYVSTNNDPAGRPRVIDLLPEVPERVYAVGRLDEETTGLMILTNDGELANRLAHPRYEVEKTYRALVAGTPDREVLNKLTEGIWLSDGKARAKRVRIAGTQGEATSLELVLSEGKKREIRRMLAKLGHKVMSLTRIAIGPVILKGLAVGEHRPLTRTEIDLLHQVAAGIEIAPPRFLDQRAHRRPPHGPQRSQGASAGRQRISSRPQGTGPAQARGPIPAPGRGENRPGASRPRPRADGSRNEGRPPMPLPGKRPHPEARAAEPVRPPLPIPGGGKPRPPARTQSPTPAPSGPGKAPQAGRGPRPRGASPEARQSSRRIIGLDPKVAAEAGVSLSGRIPKKRPGLKRRPPRRALGDRKTPEGRDEP